MFNKMDRVCVNCGRRFGRHYGVDKSGYFCDHDIYLLYEETGKKDLLKVFIDSGKKRDAHGEEYSITDPNILFKYRGKIS